MVHLNAFRRTGGYDLGIGSRFWVVFPQYAAAVSAGLTGLALGTTLAWTSPASLDLLDGKAGFPVGRHEMSVIGSLMPIGAAASSIPTGYLTDRIGRRTTLLYLVPFFLFGWYLLAWPRSIEMLYMGRFVTGMCGGAISVTAPVFTAEIAQKEIRGELSSYFQLFISLGVSLTYVAGSQLSAFYLSIACACVPLAFGLALLAFHDTPTFYLMKGRAEDAKNSLRFFRGSNYDVEPELEEIAEASRARTGGGGGGGGESAWKVFLSRPGIKGIALSTAIMAFQELSGLPAITFYLATIFQDAGSSVDPNRASIAVGFMQFAGTVVALFLVDRLGRVSLLTTSAILMSTCTIALGAYFNAKDATTSVATWLPVVSLCIFTFSFAIGYGPVPWTVVPELLPSRIVGLGTSVACVANWGFTFLVVRFFAALVDSLGYDVAMWMFAGTCAAAAIFSFVAVPETKGKSLEEIQAEMRGSRREASAP